MFEGGAVARAVLNSGASPQAVERAIKGVAGHSGNGECASRRSTPKSECTSGYVSPSEYSVDPGGREDVNAAFGDGSRDWETHLKGVGNLNERIEAVQRN